MIAGFDWHSLPLLHQVLPPGTWDMVVKGAGYLAILSQVGPRLLAWGVPAATKGADLVARAVLASPLKPLILWQAPAIIKGLDETVDAVNKINTTFKDRLVADLAAAQATVPAPQEPDKPA